MTSASNAHLRAPHATIASVYPLRYWLLVLYTVGVPNFIRFDQTGKTHEYGLFNPLAVASIGLTLGTLFLFTTLKLLTREPLLQRRVHFAAILWYALLSLFALASILQPQFRLTPPHATDLFLSLYRLMEWVLAFCMFLALYSRVPETQRLDFVSTLIANICWIWIAIVWIGLCIAPSFAFALSSDEDAHARLGGWIISPVDFGVLCAIALLHAIVYRNGTKRIAAIAFAALSLFLTYARGAQATMALSVLLYSIVVSKGLVRFFGWFTGLLAVLVAIVFAPSLISYAGRGNGLQNVLTLSERVQVWTAAFSAIAERPFLGYGFVAGPKSAIKDHWTYAHWVPPHAHNDFIQAALSGGLLATATLLILYLYTLHSSVRLVVRQPKAVFILFALIQLCTLSILTPVLSAQRGVLSSIFMFCSILVVDRAGKRFFQRTTLRSAAALGPRNVRV